MVAQHNGIEPSLEPPEGIGRMRTPVDQIADAEETIARGVKAKRRERAVEGAKATVDVADDEVTATPIDAPPGARDGNGHESGPRSEQAGAEARARSRGTRAPQRQHRSTRASQSGDMRR